MVVLKGECPTSCKKGRKLSRENFPGGICPGEYPDPSRNIAPCGKPQPETKLNQ